MPRDIINASNAPAPIGPYSHAIKVGPLLFVSGMIALDVAGNKVGAGSATKETEQAMENMKAVIEAAGGRMDQVAKTTIFVTDLADIKFVNQAYEKYFPAGPPARSTVQVVKLPKDVKVEIEAIAVLA